MPPKPGKPGWLVRNAPLIWLPFRSTRLPGGVRHLVAVVRQVRRARAELRRDVLVAEQRLVAGVAAGLVRQQVGTAVGVGVVWPYLTPLAVAQNALPLAQCTAMPT